MGSVQCLPDGRQPCKAVFHRQNADTTPLLPWRPAILSPACRRRLMAINTFTIFVRPVAARRLGQFFFLISYNSSASSRFCCRLNLISSNCLAKSSSAKRMSNQSCLLDRLAKYSGSDFTAFSQLHRTTIGFLTNNHTLDTVKCVVIKNTQLVAQVLTVTFQLRINNGLSTFVALNTFTSKDLNIDNGYRSCR